MLKSVKPLSYRGRIIMSVTDDTEQKVIKNYGGKSWRRLLNFMRGVGQGDATIGKKLGEEFVCLRQSNVPIHTHGVALESDSTIKDSTSWMVKDIGLSDTMLIGGDGSESSLSPRFIKSDVNYQISPLEKNITDRVVMPHNNMPPYKEVYIWECTQGDVKSDDNAIKIYFNVNGGEFGEILEGDK